MKAKIQHEIQEYCSLLRLNVIGEHFEEAIKDATDYEEFLHKLLRMEVDAEEERAKGKSSIIGTFLRYHISEIISPFH